MRRIIFVHNSTLGLRALEKNREGWWEVNRKTNSFKSDRRKG